MSDCRVLANMKERILGSCLRSLLHTRRASQIDRRLHPLAVVMHGIGDDGKRPTADGVSLQQEHHPHLAHQPAGDPQRISDDDSAGRVLPKSSKSSSAT